MEAQNCCSDRRETGTRSHTESEVPIVFLTKSENQTLKNGKSANHEKHHNRKTEFFFCGQNRKPQKPKASLVEIITAMTIWRIFFVTMRIGFLINKFSGSISLPLLILVWLQYFTIESIFLQEISSSVKSSVLYMIYTRTSFSVPMQDGNVLISLFLFHTLAKSHWENFWASIQKRSDLFFFKHLYFYCSRHIALKGLDLRRKWPQRLAKLQFSANLACKTKLSGFHILKF